MRKKLIMILTAFTLIFTVSSFGLTDDASARGYRSGKSSFNTNKQFTPKQNIDSNKTKQGSKSLFSNNKTTNKTSSNRGFMKGMLLGGLGGLLIGNLFGGLGLGALGSILSGFVNIIIIIGVIMIIARIFRFFKQKRDDNKRYN